MTTTLFDEPPPSPESWRRVWRLGFLPRISSEGLVALRDALERDDPALLQGATLSPPPLQSCQDWPVEAACPVAYAYWKGDRGLVNVGQVEEAFAQACFEADRALGEPASCRHLLNAVDDWDRTTFRTALLEEVRDNLAARLAGG